MPPQLRNPRQLDLPPYGDVVLVEMFSDYQEVVVKDEMSAWGYSGGRVYRVHVLKGSDAPELPLVVKIGSPGLIEREVHAYHECVRNQWPGIAELHGTSVFLHDRGVAGLCYPLMGGGVFRTQSLREYFLEASVEDIRFVLEARLFRIMDQRMLRPARNVFEHPLRASYDRILPVNLLVEPRSVGGALPPSVDRPGAAAPTVIAPNVLPRLPLQIGTWVRLEGFVVTEVEPAQGAVTLDAAPDVPPYAYRLRLQPVQDTSAYVIDQVMPPTEGVVRETRQSRLGEEAARIVGAGFDPACETMSLPGDTDGRLGVLPNPLGAIPGILSQSRHVKVNHIHGDLNLENILVDPEVRDVRLIDFAESRRDHVLLDFFRLETEVMIKILPAALAEAHLPPETVVALYERLHYATFEPGAQGAVRLPHPSLEKPFAILAAIRKAVYGGLYDRDDYGEYYEGLIVYLLGALKFDNLDTVPEAPLPKQVAFLGAATLWRLLSPECLPVSSRHPTMAALPPRLLDRRPGPPYAIPPDQVRPAPQPVSSPRKPFLVRHRGTLLTLGIAILVIAIGAVLTVGLLRESLWPAKAPDVLDTSRLCAIEQRLFIPISPESTAHHQDLLSYFQAANPELFQRLDAVSQAYLDGETHRGATYVMGLPGVGKSFVARGTTGFPEEDTCEISLRDIFGRAAETIHFQVVEKPDLVALDGEHVVNELPAIAQPSQFRLEALFEDAGCVKGDRLASLVTVDDLDEVHADSSLIVLEAIEAFLAREGGDGQPFVHIVVFGRPEGFAPWLKHSSRNPPDDLRTFVLNGPVYANVGDLEFICRNYYEWQGEAPIKQEYVDSFVRQVSEYPFLSYSIRTLSTANFCVQQSRLNPDHTAASLRHQLYDNLLERNHLSHGRPRRHVSAYGRMLEEIAARYLDQVDDEGFFVVPFEDTVKVVDDSGEVIEVRVRDVLDRSGLAFLHPVSFMTARYRFEPFWVHAHLVERKNQRLVPGYEYRTCEQIVQ
jgi:hypothetical protein